MKCAIMQPTYLPWAGYFNLINSVDCFVFLNDIQFNKRSWQQRNRISKNGVEKYLTVPVYSKGKRDQLINEVEIVRENDFFNKHLSIISETYSDAPYGNDIIKLYEESNINDMYFLQDINIKIIKNICKKLGITTKFTYSSEIPVSGKKSNYLLGICNYLNMTEYLSPVGSKKYIEEEDVFNQSQISVAYQEYTPIEYIQFNSEQFISSLSILDVIANVGFEKTKEYIK